MGEPRLVPEYHVSFVIIEPYRCLRNKCRLGFILIGMLAFWETCPRIRAPPDTQQFAGYTVVRGCSGGSPKKAASQSTRSLGDIYFADTGIEARADTRDPHSWALPRKSAQSISTSLPKNEAKLRAVEIRLCFWPTKAQSKGC